MVKCVSIVVHCCRVIGYDFYVEALCNAGMVCRRPQHLATHHYVQRLLRGELVVYDHVMSVRSDQLPVPVRLVGFRVDLFEVPLLHARTAEVAGIEIENPIEL